MTALTIILLIYWTISLFRSYRRGFVRVIVSLLLYVIFFASLKGVTPQVKTAMEKQPKITAWAQETCEDFARERLQDVVNGDAKSSLWLGLLSLPEDTASLVASDPTGLASGILLSDGTVSLLGNVLRPYVIGLMALAITAVVSGGVLLTTGIFINRLAKGRGFSGVNRIVGLMFGLVKVTVLTWILLALIHGLAGTGAGVVPETQITDSPILVIIDSLNPINRFLNS